MKNILFAIIIVLFTGCIEPYTPKNIDEVSDLLVIDGKITDNESVFEIKKSVGLLDKITDFEVIEDAELYVEKDNGERIPGVYDGNGSYIVKTGELEEGTRYRLFVAVGGEEYLSEYSSPLYTPEIDSISLTYTDEWNPVNIYVSTHDPADRSKYYRWSYNEIWEVKADLFASLGVIDGQLVDFSLSTPINTYYCWRRNSSKSLIVASSEKLSENVIDRKKLTDFPLYDERIGIVYCIQVEQNSISREAYDYYSNLQKNVDQTGGLFAPIPSEMKGNIRCITNPAIPVIGYVDVSTTTRKMLLIDYLWRYYFPMENRCLEDITKDTNFAYPRYAYFTLYGDGSYGYAPPLCVDCRLKAGASKDRPDFWPNNHY